MTDPQRAMMNLVLLAHAEIRALREVVALLVESGDSQGPLNAANWAAVEADCRRKHLEALKLPVEQFDALLSNAVMEEIRPDATDLPALKTRVDGRIF
jgi:hypothetical protein